MKNNIFINNSHWERIWYCHKSWRTKHCSRFHFPSNLIYSVEDMKSRIYLNWASLRGKYVNTFSRFPQENSGGSLFKESMRIVQRLFNQTRKQPFKTMELWFIITSTKNRNFIFAENFFNEERIPRLVVSLTMHYWIC